MQYYNNDLLLPVYASGRDVSRETKSVVSLIVEGETPVPLIATATPVYVYHNVEFIVDSSKLGDWRDLKNDLIPGMTRSATKTFYFMHIDDQFESCKAGDHDYKVTRFIYAHKDHPDFHKVMIVVSGKDGAMYPHVYIQYYFDDGEYEIIEKSKKRRSKTTFSVREGISSLQSNNIEGKKAFHHACHNAGGFESARTVADLPTSYGQVHDIKRNKMNTTNDELVELLDLCQGQVGTTKAFIRDIRTAPEKTVFLSTDMQLNDIECFCADSHCWSILEVDPTFNICDYVTITTYKTSIIAQT